MKPETKDKIFQLEISLAIIIVLVTILSFFKPTITGFVPASVYSEQLNLTIDKNTAFTIFSEAPIIVNSFKLSGEVIGEGTAHVYLSDMQGQNLLIHSNLIKKNAGKNLITGMVTGIGNSEAEERHSLIIQQINEFNENIEIPYEEDRIPGSGNFDNACIDTCSILMDLSNNKVYKMIVLIEGDATLRLKRIAYSTNDETI